MAISLQKGQKVSLAKEAPTIKELILGLGWDVLKRKGFFGAVASSNLDCDAFLIMLQNGKFVDKNDLVYYGHLRHSSGAVTHLGDNLTGAGDGDDEQIIIKLNQVPEKYDRLVVGVNIYSAHSRKQDFGMVDNAFIRLVDEKTGVEAMRYNLTDDYAGYTAMIFGEIYRHNGEWKFSAIGQGYDAGNLTEICNLYK